MDHQRLEDDSGRAILVFGKEDYCHGLDYHGEHDGEAAPHSDAFPHRDCQLGWLASACRWSGQRALDCHHHHHEFYFCSHRQRKVDRQYSHYYFFQWMLLPYRLTHLLDLRRRRHLQYALVQYCYSERLSQTAEAVAPLVSALAFVLGVAPYPKTYLVDLAAIGYLLGSPMPSSSVVCVPSYCFHFETAR